MHYVGFDDAVTSMYMYSMFMHAADFNEVRSVAVPVSPTFGCSIIILTAHISCRIFLRGM